MARSVVLRGTARCPHCQIAPRWCICAEARTLALPFGVDVLMHSSEMWKPTSTGNLIRRVVPASRQHIYHHEKLPRREVVCGSEATNLAIEAKRTTWILHPRGDSLADILRDADAAVGNGREALLANLQVVVIDGTWSQANDMLRHAEGWGQRVNLPMGGESRYWLRTQYKTGHFSTIEALLFLLAELGFPKEHAALRLQFELHVYASLLARGHKVRAADYLADSPLVAVMPKMLEKLQIGQVVG